MASVAEGDQVAGFIRSALCTRDEVVYVKVSLARSCSALHTGSFVPIKDDHPGRLPAVSCVVRGLLSHCSMRFEVSVSVTLAW
jgi:hypothetical protein